MKSIFHSRLTNGPFEDPGLYVRLFREGRAILIDPGFTTGLSARDIFKLSDVFVSHTHIDHFIGFDNILRLHLKKDAALNLYGPEGFTDKVEGKLKGYTWNLIDEYPLSLNVFEVTEKGIKKSAFRSVNFFRREDLGSEPFDGTVKKDNFFTVSAAILDHQVPCLAFSLKEDYHINIDKVKLEKMGLPVGPWLNDLKRAIRSDDKDAVFTVEGKQLSLSDVKDVVLITEGQRISYVVDALGSEENIKKIIELVKDSDLLYIETYFMDRDKERAADRYHLTAKEAGMIAREANVERMIPLHISPKYMDDPDEVIEEAMKEFGHPKKDA
jgi:ribonuclease Z